jgi:hypothetical protein
MREPGELDEEYCHKSLSESIPTCGECGRAFDLQFGKSDVCKPCANIPFAHFSGLAAN